MKINWNTQKDQFISVGKSIFTEFEKKKKKPNRKPYLNLKKHRKPRNPKSHRNKRNVILELTLVSFQQFSLVSLTKGLKTLPIW